MELPQPRIEPVTPGVEGQSLNHRPAREVPNLYTHFKISLLNPTPNNSVETLNVHSTDQSKVGGTDIFIIFVPNLSKEMFLTKTIKIIMVYDHKNKRNPIWE